MYLSKKKKFKKKKSISGFSFHPMRAESGLAAVQTDRACSSGSMLVSVYIHYVLIRRVARVCQGIKYKRHYHRAVWSGSLRQQQPEACAGEAACLSRRAQRSAVRSPIPTNISTRHSEAIGSLQGEDAVRCLFYFLTLSASPTAPHSRVTFPKVLPTGEGETVVSKLI